jgi:splicing suppressor protein 51
MAEIDMEVQVRYFRLRREDIQVSFSGFLSGNMLMKTSIQPYCSGCYRNISQLPEGSKLNLCQTCRLAHHCNSCTHSQHDSQCPRLVDIRRAEEFTLQHHRDTGEYVPRSPTQLPRKTYIPISTATSWYDYFAKISDKSMVTGFLSPDLKPLAGNFEMAAALSAATDE